MDVGAVPSSLAGNQSALPGLFAQRNGFVARWAAKGTKFLVIAQSVGGIYRSNLVGMGILPLTLEDGTSWQTLNLKGDETVTIAGLGDSLKPRQRI